MLRDVLHVRIPAFPVALARLADPSLRGRPTVVSGGGPRAVVVSVSREARAEGVRKGMQLANARRLCRSLLVAQPDPARVVAAQRGLIELVERYTPIWEPARPGRLYLEMTGGRRLFGPPRDSASKLASEVLRGMSLAPSLGVGSNKLVSGIAAKVLEEEAICEVSSGSEAAFLAPLPVGFLPGVGDKRLEMLKGWNVRSIGEFSSLPLGRLEGVFGPAARLLRERSLGLDNSPVEPPGLELKVCRGRTLEVDEIDDPSLLGHLWTLVESACRELRRMKSLACRLEVKLRHSDGLEASRAAQLVPPASLDCDVKPVAASLFIAAFTRRIRVRRLEVVFTKLCPESAQLSLFGEAAGRDRVKALLKAMDAIRNRHGFGAVGYAASLAALKCPVEEK